jgi:uncharacterized protein YjiS (DUF1127 family)
MAATPHPLPAISSAQVSGRGWLRSSLAEIRAVIGAWRRRYRYQRELERLMSSGTHLIEDIGLVRKHADREVAKPFWRPQVSTAGLGPVAALQLRRQIRIGRLGRSPREFLSSGGFVISAPHL